MRHDVLIKNVYVDGSELTSMTIATNYESSDNSPLIVGASNVR